MTISDLSRATTRAPARDQWVAAVKALGDAAQVIIDSADEAGNAGEAAAEALQAAQLEMMKAPAPHVDAVLVKARLGLLVKYDIGPDQLPDLLARLSASPNAGDVAQAAILGDLERLAGAER